MVQSNKTQGKHLFVSISTIILRKTNKSPNLEPYVVLVSYTLWCFSFFISEAVLLSLEDFPFVLCFGGGVSLYWGRNSHIVEAALLGYLLLYPTCLLGYLFYLSYLSTCSTWIYMLLYPSFEVPLDCLCGEDRYTMLPHQLWVPA